VSSANNVVLQLVA